MTICIIPARSGSKRIKNKNIKIIENNPMISYVIKLAVSSNLFSKVIVSTDSKRIKKISEKYGAEVPFLRSKKLSNDYTTTKDVIIDCIKKIGSQKTKFHFCIYPTAILLSKKDLNNAFLKIKKKGFDFLVATTEYEFSPLRAYKVYKNDTVNFIYKKYEKKRSQDLPKLIHDSGSFYIYKTSKLLNEKKNLPKKTTYFMLDRLKCVDVNYEQDLKFLKFLKKYYRHN
jgi:pseudaminic acid cytidylyltransferase